MILVCIVASPNIPAAELKELLEASGCRAYIGPPINDCDVVLADDPNIATGLDVPVVVYSKQENIRRVLSEAVVAKRFQPLKSTIDECLDLCKKG